MLSFEKANEILTDAADNLPDEIYKSLNGGIVLLPAVVQHSEGARLYILGQYHYEPWGFGRYITIHYGSFSRVYGHLEEPEQEEKLRGVLFHELTHHLEHQAGDKSLEIQDALDLETYKGGKGN